MLRPLGSRFDAVLQCPASTDTSNFEVLFDIAEMYAPSIDRLLFDKAELEERIRIGMLHRAYLIAEDSHGSSTICNFQNAKVRWGSVVAKLSPLTLTSLYNTAVCLDLPIEDGKYIAHGPHCCTQESELVCAACHCRASQWTFSDF